MCYLPHYQTGGSLGLHCTQRLTHICKCGNVEVLKTQKLVISKTQVLMKSVLTLCVVLPMCMDVISTQTMWNKQHMCLW